MTAKQAFEKAKEKIPSEWIVIGCYEFDDYFAFDTNIKGHYEIVPDMPTVQVFKATGKADWMENASPYWDEKKQEYVDPFEHAIEIDISELR